MCKWPVWVFQKPNGREKNIESTEKINTCFQSSKKLEHAVYIQSKTIYSLLLRLFIQTFNFMCITSTCLWVCFTTEFHTGLRRWSYEWCADRTLDIAENNGCIEVYSTYVNKNILFQLNVWFFLDYSFYFIGNIKISRILEWNLILKLIAKLLFSLIFFIWYENFLTNMYTNEPQCFQLFCNLDFLIAFFFSLNNSLKWTFQRSPWCSVFLRCQLLEYYLCFNNLVPCVLTVLQYFTLCV